MNNVAIRLSLEPSIRETSPAVLTLSRVVKRADFEFGHRPPICGSRAPDVAKKSQGRLWRVIYGSFNGLGVDGIWRQRWDYFQIIHLP